MLWVIGNTHAITERLTIDPRLGKLHIIEKKWSILEVNLSVLPLIIDNEKMKVSSVYSIKLP